MTYYVFHTAWCHQERKSDMKRFLNFSAQKGVWTCCRVDSIVRPEING